MKPKSVQHESKLIPKPGPGRSDKGRKRVGLFLKDSSVSHCVLAGYLFSSLDPVQSSWPCLVELAKFSRVPKSSVRFQSLLFSSKVFSSVPKSDVQLQSLLFSCKVLCSVAKSYVQLQSIMLSSNVSWSVPKSYVQVAKFSISVFLWHESSMPWALYVVNALWRERSMTWTIYAVNALWCERCMT